MYTHTCIGVCMYVCMYIYIYIYTCINHNNNANAINMLEKGSAGAGEPGAD